MTLHKGENSDFLLLLRAAFNFEVCGYNTEDCPVLKPSVETIV